MPAQDQNCAVDLVYLTCTPSYGECLFYATCDATTRTCVEEPLVGQTCDPNVAICSGGGAQCDPTSMTCTLKPTAGACS